MKLALVFNLVGQSWRAVSCAALALAFSSAHAFASGGTFLPGPADDTSVPSMGVAKIMVAPKFQPVMNLGPYPGYFNSDGRLYSPVLVDFNTIIARGSVHDNGSIAPGGEPIGVPALPLVKYSDYSDVPPEFLSPPSPTREVFTEIRKLVLTTTGMNGCSNQNSGLPPYIDPRLPVVPAGVHMILAGPGAPASLPALPGSIGQVQSETPGDPSPYLNDFPAQSFFDIFTEVNLPGVGPFPGAVFRNAQPLVVTNLALDAFPPTVIYTHSPASSAAPLVFTTSGSAPGTSGVVTWVAGEVFGWLVLAGHGTKLDCTDPSAVAAFVTATLGPIGNDLPGAPLPPQNTWNDASANHLWDVGASANWVSPTTWADGYDATFDDLGADPTTVLSPATTVTLGSAVSAHRLTFNGTNYNIVGNNFLLTMAGASPTIAANSSSNAIAASIQGTDGLTFSAGANGTNVLLGDVGSLTGNQYTGGTFVRSGTVVLNTAGVSTSGSAYGVDEIQAIDPGATVQIGTMNDGLDTPTSNVRPADGQLLRGGNLGRLHLTGGTFDNNGDNNGIQYPCPEGTGTVVNSSPYARAVMKLQGGNTGNTYVFNGQIMDGGQTIVRANSGPGYQQNIDMNGSGPYTLVLGGSNSFTGFLRLNSAGNGNKVVLQPGGTLGYPAPINCPARQILMNSGTIDLNGTSQNVGYVYTGNDANSVITNGAFGTVSVLTVCYNCTNLVAFNGAATPRGIRCALLDDPTTGGTLALTKEGVAIQPIGDYAGDSGYSALPNNYHGDTTVNNGILEASSANGISPNSAYRLNNVGILQLDYSGTANVQQLWINGVQQPNGVYGSGQTTAITGPGTLTVTGYVPPPVLIFTLSPPSGVKFSWAGSYKLQAKTNSLSGAWSDFPGGGASPVNVTIDTTLRSVFFRLSN